MKNIVLIILCILFGAYGMLGVMVTGGTMERNMELDDNLSSVVEQTVDVLFAEKKYGINDRNEFLADLVADLSEVLDSDCDITVDVGKEDTDRGILAIRVLAEFEHPDGKAGKAECARTVIFDQYEEEGIRTYTVRFYFDAEECYKTYQVGEGNTISAPENPVSERGTFSGWKDSSGHEADFSLPVTQDLIYYASWN